MKLYSFIGIATALMVVGATQSECDNKPPVPTAVSEQRATEANQKKMVTAIPLPKLTTSNERKNLVRRLERLNSENIAGCVYLINYGTVMAFYPVNGKVTSLNSYLTADTQYMDDPYGSFDAGSISVEQPDLDGAYGQNSDGVFFFTADTDSYVEWHGDYLWSDQCLKLNQQPQLVRQVQ